MAGPYILPPGGWVHHKGLSMEPLTALNQSLAHPQTSPALTQPLASQHICTVTGTKDRAPGWGGGGGLVESDRKNRSQQTPRCLPGLLVTRAVSLLKSA